MAFLRLISCLVSLELARAAPYSIDSLASAKLYSCAHAKHNTPNCQYVKHEIRQYCTAVRILMGRVGFEPTMMYISRFTVCRLKPLSHLPGFFTLIHFLEYRQVARHRFLTPTFKGSNPFTPKRSSFLLTYWGSYTASPYSIDSLAVGQYVKHEVKLAKLMNALRKIRNSKSCR